MCTKVQVHVYKGTSTGKFVLVFVLFVVVIVMVTCDVSFLM